MKRYHSYKDSGIEGIGEIPDEWCIKKLKYVTRTIIDGTHFTPTYVDTGIPFLRVTDIQTRNIDLDNVKYISEEEHKELIMRCNPRKNDLLLSKNGTIGITKVIDWDFSFSIFVSLCLIKFLNHLINPYFFSYFFQSNVVDEQIYGSSKTTSVTNLHLDKIRELLTLIPPLSEQQSIANYLDRKTHLIDTLIEKKQKLIDLLKEQRAAIINQAVTKGLNPNVKQKDSGIEWLGVIPEHWIVKKLKYTIRLINEKVENGDKYELLIPLENIEGFTGKLLNGSSSFEGSGNTFKKGDVLFNKLRPYLCKVVLTPQEGVAVGELLVFRPNDPINNRFLFYRILSTDFISIVNGSTYGAKMPRASWDFIRNLKIPLPPIIEQQSITDYLYKKTTIMDESIEKQERQIEHLKEYRTALISEVVTGKLDVRDFRIPEVRPS